MNHAGEIRPLVKMVRPHVAIITMIAPAHLGHFRSLDEIAEAKAEIFEGLEPGGAALLNRDDARFKLLDKLAQAAGVEHVYGFGENAARDFRLTELRAACRPFASSPAKIGGQDVDVADRRAGPPYRRRTRWPCWARRMLVGADVDQGGAGAGRPAAPRRGRGKRHALRHPDGAVHADRRELQRQSGLDAGGDRAARRDAGRRARAAASPCSATCWSSATIRPSCMPPWPSSSSAPARRRSFSAGPEMKALADALPGDIADGIPRRRRGAEAGAARRAAARRRGDGQIVEGHRLCEAGRGAARASFRLQPEAAKQT